NFTAVDDKELQGHVEQVKRAHAGSVLKNFSAEWEGYRSFFESAIETGCLNLSNLTVLEEDLQGICRFCASYPKIQTLRLHASGITSKHVAMLATHYQGETLDLSSNGEIDDDDLELLSRNESIKHLLLQLNHNLSSDGLKYFARNTRLERLDISYTGI